MSYGVSGLGDSQSCVICLDVINPLYTSADAKERRLDCAHVFHDACIGNWLLQKHNCPICRAPVLVDTPEAPREIMTTREVLEVFRLSDVRGLNFRYVENLVNVSDRTMSNMERVARVAYAIINSRQ